ncbi:hypothetical protein EC973_003833 [Apophysomyces ossiformis]|uniref:Uncharacterized protein n=1 Tax=Apophysomyces ossiformis TaxID=679940 RepID=A0A8H7BSV9_9FUNG|nr:hypothetical protein EC973_003833 [Apophysomyces ossiformis]
MIQKNDSSSYNHKYTYVNGIRLHYVDENSSSKNPIILFHGWPDLWFGWREQISFLVQLGYRVIVPTLRGFGETDAPKCPSEYGFKTVSKDIAELLDHLQLPTVTVLGHDWGGLLAWRFTQFYPNRVKAVASFCTPYRPESKEPITLEDIVQRFPNFKYQLYLAKDPAAEKEINAHTRQFFIRLFRPIAEMKAPLIDPESGRIVEGRKQLEKSDALPEQVLDYYVEQYTRSGANGGLNWYRQVEHNNQECKDLDHIIDKPALMVAADRDAALPAKMTEGMKDYIPNLEQHLVKGSGHWILWEKPEECNQILENWLTKKPLMEEIGSRAQLYSTYVPYKEEVATHTRRKKWLWIGLALALFVIAVIAVVVPTVVIINRQQANGQTETNETERPFYAHTVSPYANLTRLTLRNDLQSKERLFVIGDVHGCVDELVQLLNTLNYQSDKDQAILAGDLTAKGPDSLGVIRYAREQGLLCVRGNHDDKVVRFKTFQNFHGVWTNDSDEVLPEGNVKDPLHFGNEHDLIARNMTKDEYDYLASCPLIMELPFLNARVVHGGLDPTITVLEDNDPWTVLNVRNVLKGVPTRDNDHGTHWTQFWKDAQNQSTPVKVYYGHDASRGLDLEADTFGLDSGCVYGRKLSALELRTDQLTQVKCKKYSK